jgi:glycosyltransferase involved in cell wall biosynthesis
MTGNHIHKKRILYVENGIGYGGAIICLRHLVRNLDRTRYEPMVVTGLGDALYQDIASEAHWRHIPDRRFDTVGMKRRLEQAKWPASVPGMRWLLNQVIARWDDIGNFLPFLLQLLWTTWRFKADLIHANNEPGCNRASLIVGKILGIPTIAHVRGDQVGSLSMHWFYRLPDHFIPVSKWVSDSIGRVGVPAEKRTYIYDGIELDKLDINADGVAFRTRHGIAQDAFVVGLVGLLIPWKGQRLFLDAVRQLIPQMPDTVFAIVGGTPNECQAYEQELREATEQSDLRGHVVFTGHVKEMTSLYNGLDVVLSASTSPEPLGTMIIEAMTMARPLIAPNHGGAVEMVADGETGLLFEANNATSLAEKILAFYQHPDLRSRLGQAARVHALRTFAVEEHVRNVTAVYEQVLARKSV